MTVAPQCQRSLIRVLHPAGGDQAQTTAVCPVVPGLAQQVASSAAQRESLLKVTGSLLIAAVPPVGIPEIGQAVGFASLVPGRAAERESVPLTEHVPLSPFAPACSSAPHATLNQ